MTVLIAPDKFKGTLTARAAAQAIARGWSKTRPQDRVELSPMSDGGDGFGEILGDLLHAEVKTTATVDAAHRPCKARWWWQSRTKTAVIESAQVIGLAKLPPKRFHPFELDTFGLGAVLRATFAQGAKRTIVGIGGSATNDGGFGVARALGWEFLDRSGRIIEHWTQLHELTEIRGLASQHLGKIIVAMDVRNPLLGACGATRVYGPQKGLRPAEFAEAERCLRRLARVVKRNARRELALVPGTGAAGGLGFGLMAFASAKLEHGFQLFARHARLEQKLKRADLVITGEGALDGSTGMGKGVGQLASRCRALRIPCIALAGMVVRSSRLNRLFAEVHGLTERVSVSEAKSSPAFWLERLADRIGAAW